MNCQLQFIFKQARCGGWIATDIALSIGLGAYKEGTTFPGARDKSYCTICTFLCLVLVLYYFSWSKFNLNNNTFKCVDIYHFRFFWNILIYYCYCYYLLETGFLCVALAILELVLYTRLALNSDLCLPSAKIEGMHHYSRLIYFYLLQPFAYRYVCTPYACIVCSG